MDTVSKTGQPSFSERAFTSISVSLFLLTSDLFTATTTGIPSSRSCVVKNKLLLRFVPSTMFIITSGFSLFMYELVILSSEVNGDIEYAPGRSTATRPSLPCARLFLIARSFLSTVTPAQFPTFSFPPVKALNIVVLPLLGLPAKAILI